MFCGLLPESQGQNLAVTVIYVPYSLDSGMGLTSGLDCLIYAIFAQQRNAKVAYRAKVAGGGTDP